MNTSRIASDNEDLRHYGCSYSKACSGFNTSKVKSVTTQQLDADRHARPSSHGTTTYQTLPTFIRNAIDHPDPSRSFTQEDLRISIELLIKLCR